MSANKYLQQATGAFRNIAWTDVSTSASAPSTNWALTNLTNVLSADLKSTSITAFVTPASVAQGSAGVWLCLGWCTVIDTVGAQGIAVEISDGTTVWGSGYSATAGPSYPGQVACFAVATSPPGNLSLLVHGTAATTTMLIKANGSGGARDTGITAVRIG